MLTDTDLLNFQAMRRVELTPEFEGPWDAKVYNDSEEPEAIFNGNTPREALAKAAAAYGVTPTPAPHGPAGLLDRIKAAEQRIADNHAPRRIPADPHGGDVDLVLAEVRYLIEGRWPPFWIKDSSGVDLPDEGQKNG